MVGFVRLLRAGEASADGRGLTDRLLEANAVAELPSVCRPVVRRRRREHNVGWRAPWGEADRPALAVGQQTPAAVLTGASGRARPLAEEPRGGERGCHAAREMPALAHTTAQEPRSFFRRQAGASVCGSCRVRGRVALGTSTAALEGRRRKNRGAGVLSSLARSLSLNRASQVDHSKDTRLSSLYHCPAVANRISPRRVRLTQPSGPTGRAVDLTAQVHPRRIFQTAIERGNLLAAVPRPSQLAGLRRRCRGIPPPLQRVK